jgi:RNA polymerase sigma-70 factor (ECF subfamily)
MRAGADDWNLVAQARTGDMEAFALLVRRYHVPLIHFIQRMVGSQQDAEDLAQEAFIRLYRYLDRMEPHAKFSTALFGIARNLTLNFLRDGRRRGRHLTRSLTWEDDREHWVEDEARRPDHEARVHEIDASIGRALALLTPEHREVLILRELQGMDYEAIARIVRCRKGTVKSRLARAREQLRMRLQELGADLL